MGLFELLRVIQSHTSIHKTKMKFLLTTFNGLGIVTRRTKLIIHVLDTETALLVQPHLEPATGATKIINVMPREAGMDVPSGTVALVPLTTIRLILRVNLI